MSIDLQIQASAGSDAGLVQSSLEGDRQAYRQIVERYQSLVCAVTYAGCGDVHQSEDLAQETFLQAWTHLHKLESPQRLKSWLCGIARNLAASARRKKARTPAMRPTPEEEHLAGTSSTPAQDVISREEQTLLWSALQRLSPEYREPMVLFYREQESVAAVARALEISEVAARQRLVRGRAMLAESIQHLIHRGLSTTGPGKGFALAVIATIPALTFSARAAMAGTTAMKAGSSAKGAGALGILASSILGPVIGLLGGYLGYRIGLEQTIATEERTFMRRFFGGILLLAGIWTALFVGSLYWTRWLGWTPTARAAVAIPLAIFYTAALLTACFYYQRRIRQLRAEIIARRPDLQEKARATCDRWNVQYRSRWTLLGWPLVDINMGGTPDARTAVAKGWIAVGGKAYGFLFAFGAIAVAPFCMGGIAVGLFCFGGFAAGAVVWGGFAVGAWTLGGLALGIKAVGGCAIAFSAAQGAVAASLHFAQGPIALAPHANDAAAEAFFRQDHFAARCETFLRHAHWVWLLAVAPLILALTALRRGKTADRQP